jgi:hypothetical protein
VESKTTTFESLRVAVETAVPAISAAERRISWVGDRQQLAFARDNQGQLELFLLGDPLSARERTVRERLVHNTWQTLEGSLLAANRLRLPEGDHYDAIAATVLLELVDKGYERDAEDAFRRTESLIALALEPARAENAVLTGLAGELYTLASMIRLDPMFSEAHLDTWQGWGRSSRDFQLGTRGIEVKTSTTSASRHHIQGWYQVECGVAADGTVETELHLLSIGIQWLASGSAGMTVELLVKEVINAIPGHRRADFVDMVRNYCGASLLVDDDGNASQASLCRPFIPTYERLYDLQDERISVPRATDFARFSNLISDSVAFEIELPDHVRGDRNPVVGMSKALSQFLIP